MMKRTLLTLTVLAIAGASHAINIATWTFETNTPSDLSNSTSFGPLAANSGLGTLTGLHAGTGTDWTTPNGNGSQNSLSSNTWAVGDYYQFQISTLGLGAITLSFDQGGSSAGPRDFKVQYSTDGVSYVDHANYVVEGAVVPNTWSSTTYNPLFAESFSFGSVANNQSAFFVRLTMRSSIAINGGAIDSGGTSRIDNIAFAGTPGAVPEPFTMGLGIAGAGMFVRRRLKARRA